MGPNWMIPHNSLYGDMDRPDFLMKHDSIVVRLQFIADLKYNSAYSVEPLAYHQLDLVLVASLRHRII